MYKPLLISFMICVFNPIALKAQDGYQVLDKNGINSAFHFGTWVPTIPKHILKTPFIIGLSANVHDQKHSIGLSFNLIGNISPLEQSITLGYKDSLIYSNSFGGVQITLEHAYKLWQKKNWILETYNSIGYGQLDHYNPTPEINIYSSTLLFMTGVSITYMTKKRNFIQIISQYSCANYGVKDPRSTDLNGNYWVTRIGIGTYFK